MAFASSALISDAAALEDAVVEAAVDAALDAAALAEVAELAALDVVEDADAEAARTLAEARAALKAHLSATHATTPD